MKRKVCRHEEIVHAIWVRLAADDSVPAGTEKPRLVVAGLPVPGDRDQDGSNWFLANTPEYEYPEAIARAVRAVKLECDLLVPFLGASARALA